VIPTHLDQTKAGARMLVLTASGPLSTTLEALMTGWAMPNALEPVRPLIEAGPDLTHGHPAGR